jgi:alpha-D-xyloside xylohydrolase
MGVRLMVSIWPTISPLSRNYQTLRNDGMLVGTDQGVEFHGTIRDKGMEVAMPIAFYDPTNPRTREYIWSVAKRNYYDLGVRVWWLDACEPELEPGHHANLVFDAGPGAEVAGIYPRDNARMFAEGMADAANGSPGDAETVLLCRSAWAGQQKYSAAVWSGDIPATWDSLRRQVRAGLSIAIAGIPWWTTDIGGFRNGDPTTAYFRELVVRWFQFGTFCPLFRLHGVREPGPLVGSGQTGAPNEVWSFGDEAYGLIREQLALRERIRPYVMDQMATASATGLPPMRALFLEFPDEEPAWEVSDQYMFGPDVLVAPVTAEGARERDLYLPVGASWLDAWTGQPVEKNGWVTAAAPLERIPVYLREGGALSDLSPSGT